MFAYAFTFLVALAVTFVLTPVVKNFAIRIGAVDKPDIGVKVAVQPLATGKGAVAGQTLHHRRAAEFTA